MEHPASLEGLPVAQPDVLHDRQAESKFALFAAPNYLEARGPVESPEALAAHECIIFGMSTQGASWDLSLGRKHQHVPISGRLATTSVETILYACVGGFGVGHLPVDLCQPFVEEGRLVRVLPDWAGAVYGLFVVYPSRRHVSPSVRAFIDFLSGRAEASLLDPPGGSRDRFTLLAACRCRSSGTAWRALG